MRDSLGVEKKGGVTDLKFRNNEGKNLNLPRLALNAAAPVSTIYVSDASNAKLTATENNQYDTPYDVSFNTSGSGLVFQMGSYREDAFTTVHDLSGITFSILKGGKDYKIGDTFNVNAQKAVGGADENILCTVTGIRHIQDL